MKSSLEQYLIDYLMEVNNIEEKLYLAEPLAIRALMNITVDTDLTDEFYEKQDEYLKELLDSEEVISSKKIKPLDNKLCLYQGDITLIKADVLVNPANYTLIGSTEPLHDSIDSQIHSFAGLQLRRDCKKIISRLNREINPGECFVTKGYNLPVKYIIHALGPVVNNESNINELQEVIKLCYKNCLEIADGYNCKSIVIPPISTEEFGYPTDLQAIAMTLLTRAFPAIGL